MKKKTTTIRLREEYQILLREMAKENGLNPGQYVEKLLDQEREKEK